MFMLNGIILLKRPYISFSSPLLMILRRDITAAAVALFLLYCCIKWFLSSFFFNSPLSLSKVTHNLNAHSDTTGLQDLLWLLTQNDYNKLK